MTAACPDQAALLAENSALKAELAELRADRDGLRWQLTQAQNAMSRSIRRMMREGTAPPPNLA